MSLTFSKYHGLGNDFIVLTDAAFPTDMTFVRALCDRHRGVGADGILAVTTDVDDADARMVIYNRDGSRPEMCGNGVRCVVRHLVEALGFDPERVRLATDAGLREASVVDAGQGTWKVSVDMGQATVGEVPLVETHGATTREFWSVDMGNPHAVTFTPADLTTIDRIGKAYNAGHPSFPDGVNVEFVADADDARETNARETNALETNALETSALETIVYERGVGRTQACGTGACAVAAVAWHTGRRPDGQPVDVRLPGGALRIERKADAIWMTGPVAAVAHGRIAQGWLDDHLAQHPD